MYLSLILTFLLILGVTVFALQNSVLLEFTFMTWTFQTSLVAVIFASCLVGIFVGMLLTLPGLVKKHFRAKKLAKVGRQLEKRIKELEAELAAWDEESQKQLAKRSDALGSDNWLK
ncbi:MAG: DUF1049 domain-containing protein [Chitinivibrionales bacterium]|nr:DUF1049 domain-containing protein [Chitinivibrionales bacterium]